MNGRNSPCSRVGGRQRIGRANECSLFARKIWLRRRDRAAGRRGRVTLSAPPAQLAYDVVLTGIKLPDMTGYELMMKLKQMILTRAAHSDERIRLGRGSHARESSPGRPAQPRLSHQAVHSQAAARHRRNDHRLVERTRHAGVDRHLRSATGRVCCVGAGMPSIERLFQLPSPNAGTPRSTAGSS